MRLLAAGFAALSISTAPMQCKHDSDPSYRVEDTAGDGLWGLAQDFRAKNDEAAARKTLQYLVEKYPSNRHAPAAKAELAADAGSTGMAAQ